MIERGIYEHEHEVFRQTVRRFFDEEVKPRHAEWEKDGVVSRDLWLAAGEAGILCVDTPEAYGGAGADFLYSSVVIEEHGRSGCSGPGFPVHSDIVAPYFFKYATEELRQRWLPKMVKGEAIGAIAMTEPNAGSDLQNIRTVAEADGDDFVISGQKIYISNGQLADFVLVACKTDPEAKARGVSLILVEADREGFARGRNLEKVGLKAQDTSELFFDNVRVPKTNLVGTEGRGFFQMMEQLPRERLMQAIRTIGTLEMALENTLRFVTDRQAFGRPIAGFQNTRFKLADVKARSTMLRVFVDRCTEMLVAGKLDEVDGAMAKLLASEMTSELLDECLQLHGGAGYMWEYPIARAWTDARVGRIAGGTTEIMREIIGRSLVGKN